jgi:hypothetical protein
VLTEDSANLHLALGSTGALRGAYGARQPGGEQIRPAHTVEGEVAERPERARPPGLAPVAGQRPGCAAARTTQPVEARAEVRPHLPPAAPR